MSIASILAASRVEVDVPASSKKRALEQLSVLLANGDAELNSGKIFDGLLARERLGSTGLGYGIAIPHTRISATTEARGACMRLQEPVDFDAPDQQPVDFVFGLLVPEVASDEHIQILANLAEMFDQKSVRERLREAGDASELLHLMTRE